LVEMKADELRLRILSKIKHCQTNRNYYVWWGKSLYTANTPQELVAKVTAREAVEVINEYADLV
jgi:hypothetical protein